MKIFIIGAHKTGTSTLTKVLKTLNYNVCREKIGYDNLDKSINDDYDFFRGVIENHDAFEDSPWNHGDFYKWLYENYPDSKFILTIRDTYNWLESYKRWDKKRNLRTLKFYKNVSIDCYGVEDFLSDEEHMINQYNKRNSDIIEFFKSSDNFMLFDIENNNGWDDICTFLDKKVPNIKFPHENRTK